MFDVEFHKDRINEELYKLIKAFEEIINFVSIEIDIICANDDNETEIMKYEKDKNNIQDFGLFVTKRNIASVNTYYSSDTCNVYVNYKYVSFGCVF